jgi:hypothetical protein
MSGMVIPTLTVQVAIEVRKGVTDPRIREESCAKIKYKIDATPSHGNSGRPRN